MAEHILNKGGFCALVLQRDTTAFKELIIAIRGTEILNAGDRKNDLEIIFGKIPGQYKSAENFVERIIKNNACDEITITGHSLGGLLAQLVAVRFNVAATVFDSPGAKKYIRDLFGEDCKTQDIRIVNALPNIINTYGEHINLPIALVNNVNAKICLDPRYNLLGTFTKEGGQPRYLHSHRMKHLLGGIDQDGGFRRVLIKPWPKSSAVFYVSREAYDAMPEIYDKHIYQLWKKQYGAPRSA